MPPLAKNNSQEKILVVDDNPKNLRLLYTILSKKKYDVRPVLNAKQALESIKELPYPGLILLDIKMPEINGFQLCEKIKSNDKTRNIPIIFISALNNADDILQGFSVGGVDYITKPFHEKEVLARVNTQISLRNQQKQLEIKNARLEKEIYRRKQTEKELIIAKNDADRANQSKSTFLSNISHELRTPLNAIIGFANLLFEDNLLNKNQRESSQIIMSSGKSLLSLINEILDIEKIEAGKFELFKKDFCLAELLNEVIALMKITAIEKGIDLILEIDEKLPPYIYADPNRLSQVLLNLINNAIKFTKNGSVSLRVYSFKACEDSLTDFTTIVETSQKIHSHQTFICFEVIDTGIGIAKEHHEIIFKAFEQTGSKQFRSQGTGLGLHICKKWIEKMDGRLHLLSQEGVGSTFRVDLYMIINNNTNIQQSNYKKKSIVNELQTPDVFFTENDNNNYSQNIKTSSKGSKKILLIVDDTPANCQLLTMMLKPHNIKTIIAENGIEAIELAEHNTPDLIMLDLMMPEMDGAETIKLLRLIPDLMETPVVVVSSIVKKKNFHEFRELGFNDYLAKPIILNDLNACLQKYL